MLYPDRRLSRFIEKNNIPIREIRRSRLLQELLAAGNKQLIERDLAGQVHFNPAIRNAHDVEAILDQLPPGGLARRERALILEIFERVFDHQSFTGRSGTFFGYEGLGCIYWHMVSKLLLAAQESFACTVENGAPTKIVRALAERYYDIRAGLGDCKTPQEYGAFPTDPYSHTPGHAGARQPGLTGQVKEDILCRFGELGIRIHDGTIRFEPRLLSRKEFLERPDRFDYFDLSGQPQSIGLPIGSLAFTYCQTPIVYFLAERQSLTVRFQDDTELQIDGTSLDKQVSASILDRTGEVASVLVSLGTEHLFQVEGPGDIPSIPSQGGKRSSGRPYH